MYSFATSDVDVKTVKTQSGTRRFIKFSTISLRTNSIILLYGPRRRTIRATAWRHRQRGRPERAPAGRDARPSRGSAGPDGRAHRPKDRGAGRRRRAARRFRRRGTRPEVVRGLPDADHHGSEP